MKIFKYIGVCTAGLLALASCSPEDYSGPDQNGIPSVAAYADNFTINVDQSTNTANFAFKAADGVTPVWKIDGAYSSTFSSSKFYRKAGDYSAICRVMNANGISADSVIKTFHVNKTQMNGFGGFVEDSEYNLFKDATYGTPTFWYAPGWTQIADPAYTANKGSYTVTLPKATTDQWQAQTFIPTNVSLQGGKHYDFSCILTSTTDHPHVTVKIGSVSQPDFVLYYNNAVKLEAGEPLCVYFSDVEAPNDVAGDLELIFDFGGNAENTDITAESFVIKDHDNDDGTVVPAPDQAAFVYASDDNLWWAVDKAGSATFGGYYAPGWSQIDNAVITHDGSSYTIALPSATYERWQAQASLTVPDGIEISADEEYDFCAEFSSNNALGGVTCKVQQPGSDDEANGNFLESTDGNSISVPAGGTYKYQVVKKKFSKSFTGLKIVFDFGGNPANTTVTVNKITLQKHKE